MNEDELIEKVASALRAMKHEPTALIFNNNEKDWTFDKAIILNLPVWHSCFYTGLETAFVDKCPFLPVFDKEFKMQSVEIKRFYEGFVEAV